MPRWITLSATRFVFCPECGQHGFIMSPDGKRSPIIMSKEAAVTLIDTGRRYGYVAESELPELFLEVETSHLLEKNSDIRRVSPSPCSSFNIVRNLYYMDGKEVNYLLWDDCSEEALNETIN